MSTSIVPVMELYFSSECGHIYCVRCLTRIQMMNESEQLDCNDGVEGREREEVNGSMTGRTRYPIWDYRCLYSGCTASLAYWRAQKVGELDVQADEGLLRAIWGMRIGLEEDICMVCGTTTGDDSTLEFWYTACNHRYCERCIADLLSSSSKPGPNNSSSNTCAAFPRCLARGCYKTVDPAQLRLRLFTAGISYAGGSSNMQEEIDFGGLSLD
ncbi:uncharacterized protein V1516DRAFT_662479 [Lipomyces oligophaga]|uniref:uncharacterized protein n=1 Tax=Lipomyces oligophaga TaxID=45792 RepID=UPI0034CEC4C9